MTQDTPHVTQADYCAVVEKMVENRKRELAACERMIELLQPEWDRFEARTGHDVYVARDYADHTSAARRHRSEIAALEALLTRTAAEAASREEVARLREYIAATEAVEAARRVANAARYPEDMRDANRDLCSALERLEQARAALTAIREPQHD